MQRPLVSLLPLAIFAVVMQGAAAEVANATVITRDTDFVAVHQNPFVSGPASPVDFQQSIPLPTTRTDFPALVIPSPVPPAYFSLGGAVTGDMDLTFYGSVNPGRLNINYPVETQFTIPDFVGIGQTFSLETSSAVVPGGYTQLNSVPVTVFGANGAPHDYLVIAQSTVGAPSLKTSNPGIGAAVDFDITNHNFLYLQGCVPNPFGSDFCEDIVKKDLPSLGSRTFTLLSASTAGNVQILPIPGLPGFPITYGLPQTIPLGTFASITVDKPNLAQTGVLSGSDLVANKTSNIATLTLSIDGLISSAVLNPLLLPPLTGSVGPVDYSLLKADASLHGGLYQNLDFSARTDITLTFDHLVRARVNGVDKGGVFDLSFSSGDNVKLSPLGFTTGLHVSPVFFLHNSLDNHTGIALSGELSASALSASLGDLGSIGPLVKGDAIVPLGNLEVYKNSFNVDMKPVFGSPFDVDFQSPIHPFEVQITQVSDDGNGHAVFHFLVTEAGNALTDFDVTGRTQQIPRCSFCDLFDEAFLPDDDVSITLENQVFDLGDVFCVVGTCTNPFDVSSLAGLIHEADVPGSNPVFFADAGEDLQIPDPTLTDFFVSHFASMPDPGFTYADNPALFLALTTVPEPNSPALLAAALIGLIFANRGRRMLLPG